MRPLALLLPFALLQLLPAQNASRPFDGKFFHGRIAWSADGNHNDEDDWAASPVALALFAQFGVKAKLVHFDYNSILTANNPEWASIHADSVLGAASRYGYPKHVFHDSQKDQTAAIASLSRAINASTPADPLYLVIAGPMELAHRAILAANPAKRKFVHAISHSRWNDGFDLKYQYKVNKRAVIETGVHWIQIRDQNAYLSTSPFGRPANEAEWQPWLWMQNSPNPNVRFLFERLNVTSRADCSDAGMAWFLLTGDDQSKIEKLRPVLENAQLPKPAYPRPQIRLEAENFQTLQNFTVEYKNDRALSHRISLRQAFPGPARIETRFQELYAAKVARYEIDVRYLASSNARLTLFIDNQPHSPSWSAPAGEPVWRTHTLSAVAIPQGAQIAIQSESAAIGLDYIDLRIPAQTIVSMQGDDFLINGRKTYEGRTWNGHRVEGLLMNNRLVQATFDDLNPETVSRWAYPDTRTWDPERNTTEFLAAMPEWKRHGILSFTVNFQGGSPEGYSKGQPWENHPFHPDGTLRPAFMSRMKRVLNAADKLGMVPIVGYFYFGQSGRLQTDENVIKATDTLTRWLLDGGWKNILVEINNESNPRYNPPILRPDRVHELITRVRNTKAKDGRRVLVGTSFPVPVQPTAAAVKASDFALVHGNAFKQSSDLVNRIRFVRSLDPTRKFPVLVNEDDHNDFADPDGRLASAVAEHASWGWFDWRRPGELFEEGYQSVPVHWGLSSSRKVQFHQKVAEITGSERP